MQDKRPIEDWAKDKGFLPQMQTIRAQVGQLAGFTERLNPQYHRYAMAKAHRSWVEGTEVTEEEFDGAIKEAGEIPLM